MTVVSGCGLAGRGPAGADPGALVGARDQTLVVAVGGEPRTLVPSVGGSPSTASDALFDLVHTSLVVLDDRAQPIAAVARELPSIERGTWRVDPDGSMQTEWRLRDDVRWHDGQPISAADVVFSWQVFSDPSVPVASRRAARMIDSMESPDPRTVVIHWHERYGFADQLTATDLTLLPSHLLEATFDLRRDQFASHPYWRSQFIGLGPFRVQRWPSGSSIELAAFDGYFGGAPRLREVSVRFISDDSSAMAAVLEGSIDILLPRRVAQGVVRTVRDRWRDAEQGTVAILPGYGWIYLAPQFISPRPEELLDPRVRQALTYSLDRASISDALVGIPSLGAELWLPSTDPRFDEVIQQSTRYRFDPAAARELFREAGWRREGIDDALVRQGRRFEVEVTTVTALERTAAVVVDSWRDSGILARVNVLQLGGLSERQARATYSGVEVASGVPSVGAVDARLHSTNTPGPANQWAGANRGRYSSAELDSLFDRFWATLESGPRTSVEEALARHISADLPLIPLAFSPSMAIARGWVGSIRPPTGGSHHAGRLSFSWNAHEWEKRSPGRL